MTIRENNIYYIFFFLGYGFYGSGISVNSNLNIVYILSPIFSFLLIFFLKKENDIIFQFNIKKKFSNLVSRVDFIFAILIFLILFYLTFEKITLSISDDEYAYSSLGLIHSNFIISKISNLEQIADIKVKNLYRIISFFLILSVFLYFLIINFFIKNKTFYQLCLLVISVILIRYVIFISGGNSFPHPAFIGLPTLVATSLFGLSDLSIKLFYFLIYFFFAVYYYLRLKNFTNRIVGFIITISLFSIPGVLYLGTSVEQSLFSLICFSIILIELNINDKPDYKKLIIIVLFFSFFRILSLISLALIFFHILINSKSLKDLYYQNISLIKKSYSLLLVLPFVFFSFSYNPTITVNRVGLNFLSDLSFFKQIPKIIIDSFTPIPGLIVIILIIFSFLFWKKNFKLIIFTSLNIIIYGNVLFSPTWDNKYSYEIFFPILIFLYYHLIKKNYKKIVSNILIITSILIFSSNLIILKKFNFFCLENKNPLNENHYFNLKFGCKIIFNHPFDLKTSYNFLKNQNKFNFKNLYVPGVYYGLLPSVINGMKTSEYMQHREINIKQNRLNELNSVSWISASSKNINQDERINYVLLADLIDAKKIELELLNTGWSELYRHKHSHYNTLVVILNKKN